MYRNLMLLIFGATVIAGAISILQIWFTIFTWDVFVKFLLTIGILVVLAAFALIVRGDIEQHKTLKDNHYID